MRRNEQNPAHLLSNKCEWCKEKQNKKERWTQQMSGQRKNQMMELNVCKKQAKNLPSKNATILLYQH